MTTNKPMGVTEARSFFFREFGWEKGESGFAIDGWRGAVLYRDQYGRHAMPMLLWNALREAGGASRWWVCGYGEIGKPEPRAVPFSFGWDAFAALPGHPARRSSEWVAYNADRTIAVLAEFDVTIVGAAGEMADRIDGILRLSGTDLRALTHADFPEQDRLEPFIRSVTK
jgi:hypothetical protein